MLNEQKYVELLESDIEIIDIGTEILSAKCSPRNIFLISSKLSRKYKNNILLMIK